MLELWSELEGMVCVERGEEEEQKEEEARS